MQPHTQATPDRGGGDARLSADSSDSESSSGSEASGSDAELAAGAARTSDQSANTDRRKSGKQRVKSQDGRANKMVARHYSKIVERLTRISLTLEDPSSVAPMRKKATRTTKKLAKHMLKYEKELAKLDKLIESRSASHLVYGTLPLGLLNAVDDYVDPDDWTKACVLDEHKRKTDELRGVLRAIGVWDANTRHRLIHGTVPDPLLPPRTAPLRSSSNADERSTAETETATAAPPTPPPAKAPATPT
eukprot:GHVT01020384.1.p1 GENE.GHVT01020384.1~~GHVT01020384.1.p1  ORF type:complete len:247 (+),score=50.58 GHVT01020384.1:356-1096(+)